MIADIFLFIVALAAASLAWLAWKNVGELRQRIDDLEKKLADMESQKPAEEEEHPAPQIDAQPIIVQPVIPQPEQPAAPKPIFLSRADAKGAFSRHSTDFELGNSLFVLSPKGSQGTFVVIDDPDVHQLALMMPTDNLLYACQGEDLQRPGTRTRIVTDQSGTAKLENGVWIVTRKARIHYE